MKSLLYALKAVLMSLLLIPTFVWAAPPNTNNTIQVVAFNILAPCWASPSYYPASSLPLLNREFRRERIIAFLQQEADQTAIFALQETTETELVYINNALKNRFVMYAAYHSPNYWSNWITIDPPYERNGVAIFVKKGFLTNVIFQDTPLSDSGNHGAYLIGKLASNSQKQVRIASIHLDSDKAYNRDRELKALLAIMTPVPNSIDFILGDFNFEVQSGNLKSDLTAAGFVDILSTLGRDGPTSPYSSKYYKAANMSDIDHMLVRNATPIDGKIFSFNLWNLYPTTDPANEEKRINANFSISGSDHFPVNGKISY